MRYKHVLSLIVETPDMQNSTLAEDVQGMLNVLCPLTFKCEPLELNEEMYYEATDSIS